ncbi:hypothetical protein [Nocardia carnea]|uniref:hypothetical protein n=1 Tax=Nocardia carnea TaxID=37328 RepID=UPI0002FA4CDA|nr:hypothetical protein [Nocardia carnea]
MLTIAARELSTGDHIYLEPRAWGSATVITAVPQNSGKQILVTFRRTESGARGAVHLTPDTRVERAPRGEILQVFYAVNTDGRMIAIYRDVDIYFRLAIFPNDPGITALRYCTKQEAEEIARRVEAEWTDGQLDTKYRHHDF